MKRPGVSLWTGILLTLLIVGLRGVLHESGVLVQQGHHHLEQAHLPEHLAEDGVVAAELEQRAHGGDAALVGHTGLEKNADAEQLLAGHVVQAKDHELQQLEVLGLHFRKLGDLLAKLGERVLRLQDEVVGVVGHVDVGDGIQDDARQAAGFGF